MNSVHILPVSCRTPLRSFRSKYAVSTFACSTEMSSVHQQLGRGWIWNLCSLTISHLNIYILRRSLKCRCHGNCLKKDSLVNQGLTNFIAILLRKFHSRGVCSVENFRALFLGPISAVGAQFFYPVLIHPLLRSIGLFLSDSFIVSSLRLDFLYLFVDNH